MSGGSGLSLRSDDLDSVSELYAQDDFRQLAVAIESPLVVEFSTLGLSANIVALESKYASTQSVIEPMIR